MLSGGSLQHTFTTASSGAPQTEHLANPDDLTVLGDHLFVGFQNGVGPQGEPSKATGNLDSTVVEFTATGREIAQWDVQGKVDGLTADPWLGGVIATVNEDANSSLYTIQPRTAHTGLVTHFSYSEALPHAGGTDAVTIDRGHIFVSASAPGTSGAASTPTPAVYSVSLDRTTDVATVTPLFFDQDSAIDANVSTQGSGKAVTLALTDPDSNFLVPFGRFAGDVELTSQGDLEQIFVSHPGSEHQMLRVLTLSQSVDDTAWPSAFGGRWGRLFATDSTSDTVDVLTGDFARSGPLTVATPCGANAAPNSCSSVPATPSNYLATVNLFTGTVTAVDVQGVSFVPQGGLAYVGSSGPEAGH